MNTHVNRKWENGQGRDTREPATMRIIRIHSSLPRSPHLSRSPRKRWEPRWNSCVFRLYTEIGGIYYGGRNCRFNDFGIDQRKLVDTALAVSARFRYSKTNDSSKILSPWKVNFGIRSQIIKSLSNYQFIQNYSNLRIEFSYERSSIFFFHPRFSIERSKSLNNFFVFFFFFIESRRWGRLEAFWCKCTNIWDSRCDWITRETEDNVLEISPPPSLSLGKLQFHANAARWNYGGRNV